jgi:hypothetical protein
MLLSVFRVKHFLRDINSAAILGSPVFIALASSLSGFYGPPWASAPTDPKWDRGNHGLFSRNHYGEKTDLRPSDYVGTRCDFVDAICVFVGDDVHGVPLENLSILKRNGCLYKRNGHQGRTDKSK